MGKLRDGLASSAPRLTGHELNRRRDLLDSLQRKERSLRDVVSEEENLNQYLNALNNKIEKLFSSRSVRLLEEEELGTSCLAGEERSVLNKQMLCRQSGLADLGTSGWGSPSAPQSATVVPNRTGMRETESTAGRSSIQVFCIIQYFFT